MYLQLCLVMCTPTIFVISLMFCWYQFQWLMLALVCHNGWLNINTRGLLAFAVWLSIDWFKLRTCKKNSLNCNSTHSNWNITFHISFENVISINYIYNVYDPCVNTGERSSYKQTQIFIIKTWKPNFHWRNPIKKDNNIDIL